MEGGQAERLRGEKKDGGEEGKIQSKICKTLENVQHFAMHTQPHTYSTRGAAQSVSSFSGPGLLLRLSVTNPFANSGTAQIQLMNGGTWYTHTHTFT